MIIDVPTDTKIALCILFGLYEAANIISTNKVIVDIDNNVVHIQGYRNRNYKKHNLDEIKMNALNRMLMKRPYGGVAAKIWIK